MKKAFTLAEVLITLGIIAVIAIVTLPLVSNIKPDSNKALYLKAYDRLCKCVHQVAMDSSIYQTVYNYNGIRYNTSYYPLFNVGNAIDPSFEDYSGTSKLPNIMMTVLGGTGSSYKNFVTKDGITWKFEDSAISGLGNTTGNATFYTPVTIDVDENSPDTSSNEKRPHKFKFYITATGEVVPADKYGQMYIATRKLYKRNANEANILNQFQDLTNSANSIPDVNFDIAKIVMSDNTDGGGGTSELNPETPDPNPNPVPDPEPQDPPKSIYWTGTVKCDIVYHKFGVNGDIYMYNYTTQITEEDKVPPELLDERTNPNFHKVANVIKRNFEKDYPTEEGYYWGGIADIRY